MAAVALAVLGIGVYTFVLLRTEARPLGIFWLIFFALLALALVFMSRREYRRLRQIGSRPPSSGVLQPSPLAVESQLRKLRPRPRRISYFALAFAWVALSLPLLVARGVKDRLIASGWLIAPIVGTFMWNGERRIVSDFAITLATVKVIQQGGRYPQAIYQFRPLEGGAILLEGTGSRGEYVVGTTVPVLYRRSDPAQNATVNDFIFYWFEAGT